MFVFDNDHHQHHGGPPTGPIVVFLVRADPTQTHKIETETLVVDGRIFKVI